MTGASAGTIPALIYGHLPRIPYDPAVVSGKIP